MTNVFEPSRVEAPAGMLVDQRDDGQVYVYFDPDIALAVKVAMVTARPLLLSGPSGCGKSTLARNIAQTLGRRFYEHVITARTEPRDLLYRIDVVRRLNDAQSKRFELDEMPPIEAYIEPGVLWWAFSPETAVDRGGKPLPESMKARDPSTMAGSASVVLIDEIDKADPDVPNGLLVPLGSSRFTVEPTNFVVKLFNDESAERPRGPLIIITNNNERELPVTFIRRCVALTLRTPTELELVEIAQTKIEESKWDRELFRAVAQHLIAIAEDQRQGGLQRWSTAEYVDTVRACIELGIKTDSPLFSTLQNITLIKKPPSGDWLP